MKREVGNRVLQDTDKREVGIRVLSDLKSQHTQCVEYKQHEHSSIVQKFVFLQTIPTEFRLTLCYVDVVTKCLDIATMFRTDFIEKTF